MKFRKYSSIENSYREKFLHSIRMFVDPKMEWVCLEKIHGSNLSFLTDGKDVKVAKRTSIVQPDENFYNANDMLEKYKESALKLFNKIKSVYQDTIQIQIFGEHFGGIYGDKNEPGHKKIQKEVHYIPFTDFMVFDIRVFKSLDEDVEDCCFYLDWDDVRVFAEEVGFKIVPEIGRGDLDSCLQMANDGLTLVPELYGLEPIKDNIMEGTVIKPVKNIVYRDSRVILKNKNEKFKEKGKVKSKNKNKVASLTEEDRKWIDEITKYFEKNRLDALFSKGEVEKDWKQFNKISGLFFKDALEDFLKDNEEFKELEKSKRKVITNLAQHEANAFVREILKREI